MQCHGFQSEYKLKYTQLMKKHALKALDIGVVYFGITTNMNGEINRKTSK
jgi:hypothetical protein